MSTTALEVDQKISELNTMTQVVTAVEQREEYDDESKKFADFEVQRSLENFSAAEEAKFLAQWFRFWEPSVLAMGLKKQGFPGQLYERIETMADVLVVLALMLIVEAGWERPRTSVIAAIVGYYVAGAVFGIGHMALHAMMLDYHWSGSPTAFFHFAYLHHRTKHAHTFPGQLLIMLFPSTRSNGSMLYEYFKYGVLFVAMQHRDTRLLVGWFGLSWILAAAAHHHVHHGKLPCITRSIIACYDVLGLVPSPAKHKLHHDTNHPTRFNNFTDLNAVVLDKILTAIWDDTYRRHYHRGTMYQALAISDSILLPAMHSTTFFIASLVASIVGHLDPLPFFAWMTLFTHILLVAPLRNIIIRFLTFFDL